MISNPGIQSLGITTGNGFIKDNQVKFLKKLYNLGKFRDSFVFKVIELSKHVKSLMGVSIQELINDMDVDIKYIEIQRINLNIRGAETTCRQTYITINPSLRMHEKYTILNDIPEWARVSFTRLRLSSHYLKIETGRWSRTPRCLRLCECGEVQTEEHVLISCPYSNELRQTYRHISDRWDSIV